MESEVTRVTELTTRPQAGAILSGRKLEMLEEAGITVVDRQRLQALETVMEAVKAWKVERQKLPHEIGPTMDDEKAHQKKLRALERDIITAFNVLEAMDKHG